MSFTNCLFSSGVSANNRTGITITNSRILGVIDGGGTSSSCDGWILTDVEIDGGTATTSALHSNCNGITLIRANVHNVGQCFYSGEFVIIDSYCHGLYGAPASHNEGVPCRRLGAP